MHRPLTQQSQPRRNINQDNTHSHTHMKENRLRNWISKIKQNGYCPPSNLCTPQPWIQSMPSSKPSKTYSMTSRAKETTCCSIWTRETYSHTVSKNHKQCKSLTNNMNRWGNTSKWLESHNHGQIILGKLTTSYCWHFTGLTSRWSHSRNDNNTCCSNI